MKVRANSHDQQVKEEEKKRRSQRMPMKKESHLGGGMAGYSTINHTPPPHPYQSID
jgi:hypothetical protein